MDFRCVEKSKGAALSFLHEFDTGLLFMLSTGLVESGRYNQKVGLGMPNAGYV